MIVELHERGAPPRDVTGLTGALRFTHTTQGTGSASLTLYIPLRDWGRQPPIAPGTWVVIRDKATRRTHWWGRVSSVSSGRAVGGHAEHSKTTLSVQVEAEDFVAMLSRARMIMAPGMPGADVPGAVYQFKSWGPAFTAWMQGLTTNQPGELLARVFQALAKQRLPESLGGETLGDAIHVAWFPEAAPEQLRNRFLSVPGYALQAFGNVLPSGTVWGMLSGTFGADPRLTEMFHGVYEGVGTTALEQALGSVCPLVYRMAPLHPNLPVFGPGSALAGLFQSVPTSFSRRLSESDVLRWSVKWSDADRQNGFFAETYLQPKSQMGTYGILGTPIIDSEDAEDHGLRFFEATWPFFPSTADEGAESMQIIAGIDALVEYAAHVLQDGHLKGSGTLDIRPDAFLRPGDWISAQVEPGMLPWSCYVHTVTHSANVDPDTALRTDTTSVGFSRGFFGVTGDATPAREGGGRAGAVEFESFGGVV